MKVLFIVLVTYLSLMGLLFNLMLIFRTKSLELVTKIQEWMEIKQKYVIKEIRDIEMDEEKENDLTP